MGIVLGLKIMLKPIKFFLYVCGILFVNIPGILPIIFNSGHADVAVIIIFGFAHMYLSSFQIDITKQQAPEF
jgi:hypothetical protein